MRPGARLTLILLAIGTVAALVGGAAWWSWRVRGDAELLAVDGDNLFARPGLVAFARHRAAPIYRRYCASCHGADFKGDRRRGVADLTSGAWLYGEGRVSEIEQTLTHGIRAGDPKGRNLASMPAYGEPEPYARYRIPPLSPPDIRDVTEYLMSVEARPADPAAMARGDVIFHTRGGCYDCHGADAHGDGAIGAPNLRDQVWLYGGGSRREIFDSIAQGRAGACPSWFGRLSAAEIRALAVFVRIRARGGAT